MISAIPPGTPPGAHIRPVSFFFKLLKLRLYYITHLKAFTHLFFIAHHWNRSGNRRGRGLAFAADAGSGRSPSAVLAGINNGAQDDQSNEESHQYGAGNPNDLQRLSTLLFCRHRRVGWDSNRNGYRRGCRLGCTAVTANGSRWIVRGTTLLAENHKISRISGCGS